MSWRALAAAALAACGAAGEPPSPPAERPDLLLFTGACDASGAIAVGGSLLAVANDEDNALRIYDVRAPGAPLDTIGTRTYLADQRGKHPEMDLEAAARIGDRIYWLASHGRKKSGKPAPSRLRLFATDVLPTGRLAFVGAPYARLVEDLVALPGAGLAAAADRPPDAPGGLNIEGLSEDGEGGLWLGFRSPLQDGRALLVPVENPAAMVESGARARLGQPVALDLGRRGVRGLARAGGSLWILAGSPDGRPVAPALYRWQGGPGRRVDTGGAFAGLNPEAIAVVGGRFLVLSDDGERDMGGTRCKRLKEPGQQRFRAVWLAVDPAAAGPGAGRHETGSPSRDLLYSRVPIRPRSLP